jgi:hypothetical protein
MERSRIRPDNGASCQDIAATGQLSFLRYNLLMTHRSDSYPEPTHPHRMLEGIGSTTPAGFIRFFGDHLLITQK